MTDLWENEDSITSLGIEVPEWIDQEISPYDVAAIIQGGCDSGAYMLAVTHQQAAETMAQHGDDVLDFIECAVGELPRHPDETSWSGLAAFYLSYAVELWADAIEAALLDAIAAREA